jgi:hypothetical protein
MPLLALNRKEKGWRINWHIVRPPSIWPSFACKPSQYGGIVTGYHHTSRKGGYIAS